MLVVLGTWKPQADHIDTTAYGDQAMMKAVQITMEIWRGTWRNNLEELYRKGPFKELFKESYFTFRINSHRYQLFSPYPCDISLHLPLVGCKETICGHGVGVFHCVDNGGVAEEHYRHRDEKAEDEDGDDVGFVDGGVIGFGPVHFTGTVSSI